jgi:tetratricopeptide (TPR) repeat protein
MLSQPNVDGSMTVLTTTYIFETEGKVTLSIIISKGIGIATTSAPFGNLPAATARTLSGIYKVGGSSIHIDFTDRAIEATISDDFMKGVLITKSNNQRSDWKAVRTSDSNDSSRLSNGSNPPQPPADVNRNRRIEAAFNKREEGKTLYGLGKFSEAIVKFNEAINLAYDVPFRFYSYFDRGRARFKLQDYQGAIGDFDKSVTARFANKSGVLNVQDKRLAEDSYEGRGNAKLAINDYRGAIADYNQFLELYEKPYELYEGEQGADLLMSPLYERKAEVYHARGKAKYELNDRSGACGDFRESCKLENSLACETVKKVCNQR